MLSLLLTKISGSSKLAWESVSAFLRQVSYIVGTMVSELGLSWDWKHWSAKNSIPSWYFLESRNTSLRTSELLSLVSLLLYTLRSCRVISRRHSGSLPGMIDRARSWSNSYQTPLTTNGLTEKELRTPWMARSLLRHLQIIGLRWTRDCLHPLE